MTLQELATRNQRAAYYAKCEAFEIRLPKSVHYVPKREPLAPPSIGNPDPKPTPEQVLATFKRAIENANAIPFEPYGMPNDQRARMIHAALHGGALFPGQNRGTPGTCKVEVAPRVWRRE